MNDLREFLTDPVVIFGFIIFVLVLVGFKWFLKRLEMNPAGSADDLADADNAGSLSDAVTPIEGRHAARAPTPTRAAPPQAT